MADELYRELHAVKDSAGFGMKPLKKGDAVIMAKGIVYSFDEMGKMKRIRMAHFRMHDEKMAKFAHA